MSTTSQIVTRIAFDIEKPLKTHLDEAEQLRVWREWRAFKLKCDAIDRRERIKRGVWLGIGAVATVLALGVA